MTREAQDQVPGRGFDRDQGVENLGAFSYTLYLEHVLEFGIFELTLLWEGFRQELR